MKCYFKKIQSLKHRNIEVIYECKDVNYVFSTIEDLTRLVYEITLAIAETLGLNIEKLLFSENEPIGLSYIVYKFHTLFKKVENAYCSCRLVAYKDKVKLAVCTLDNAEERS